MAIRKAVKDDIAAIMACIADAQRFLRSLGVDQWQDGYPTADIIENDIESEHSFVVEQSGEVVATAVISFDGEPTYSTIEGEWLNSNPYAVIHRLAVLDLARGKGYAKELFDYAESLCQERQIADIRVDTHADNRVMQRLLSQLEYRYCGEITLTSGAKRIALQKSL